MQINNSSLEVKRKEIESIILRFTEGNLCEQYNALCKQVLDEVVRVYGEAIKKGKVESWAAGILHAILTENKELSSKGGIKASTIYTFIGISSSAALSKSKDIRSTMVNGELFLNEVEGEVAASLLEEDNSKKINKLKETIKDVKYLLAQDIIKKAWDSKNFKTKLKYAKEAIEVCPKCSDGYIILSKDSKLSQEERKELLVQAVQASLDLLNVNNIEGVKSEEWKREDLTPLFAAQYKLSINLWECGERKEAIENIRKILEMDKEDKLMVRGVMCNWLIILKREEELQEMLEKYRTDFLTSIHYTSALLQFSRGNSYEADRAVRKAYGRNPHVLDYITRKKRVAEDLPVIRKYGSEEEAMHYMKDGALAWKSVEGAIEWIKEFKKSIN